MKPAERRAVVAAVALWTLLAVGSAYAIGRQDGCSLRPSPASCRTPAEAVCWNRAFPAAEVRP